MKKLISVLLALAIVLCMSVPAFAAEYKGDVDKNGEINSADALAILKYSVGLDKEIDVKYADINGDGQVNSADALIALQISVGLVEAQEIEADEPAEKNPLEFTKDEIVEFYNNAITASYKEKVTVTSKESVSISLNSITGGELVKSIANSIVANYSAPTTLENTFTDGKSADGVEIGYFSACKNIDAEGVAKAAIKANGKGYEVEITVVPEKSSLEKEPKYNAQSSRPLDLDTVDLMGAKVTKADFNYTGTVLKAVIDENGKVVSTSVTMPLGVIGEGKLGLKINVDASGVYTNDSTFVY